MTERTNGHETNSENPSRPEGQDTSEAMDNKSEHDTDTTAVLPSTQTPPTQEIAQTTEQVPEGPAPEGPAPEGEVHPAYGVAAARAQEEEQAAEPAAAAVQDAPAPDDSDPLAPLRDPEPQAPATAPVMAEVAAPASGPVAGPAPAPASGPAHHQHQHQHQQHQHQHQHQQPHQLGRAQPQPTQPQPAQPAAPAATKRGPRVGTAVWGLIVIAVGLGILAVAAGVVFDVGVALIVLLGVAGVILVVGSVVSSVRRR